MSKNKQMFYSLYSASEMRSFKSKSDLLYVIGVVIDGAIIKPPRCRVCGEFVFVDSSTGYTQCTHCNNMTKFYYNDSINIRKEWSSKW